LTPNDLFIFNTAGAASQALLHYGQINNPDMRIAYVEDGMAAYNSGTEVVRESQLTYRLEKLFFGGWYQQVRIMGESDRIDQIFANFPECVRESLQSKPVHKIQYESLLRQNNQSWLSDYIRNVSGEKPYTDADAVILLTHSNNEMRNEYAKMIKLAINELQIKGLDVAVKYHPRDPNPGFVDLSPDVVTLSRKVPVEAYYLLDTTQLTHVVGGTSTGLLTGLRLLEAPAVVSLAPLFGGKFSNLTVQLREFDVSLVNSQEELIDSLKIS
jgi:hypothetical protein